MAACGTMSAMAVKVRELIADLPAGDEIPLPVVRDIVNGRAGLWDKHAQSYAVRTGAIRVARPARNGEAHVVERSEAIFVLVAASLALAAGVAVVGMLRVLRESGIDPQVFLNS